MTPLSAMNKSFFNIKRKGKAATGELHSPRHTGNDISVLKVTSESPAKCQSKSFWFFIANFSYICILIQGFQNLNMFLSVGTFRGGYLVSYLLTLDFFHQWSLFPASFGLIESKVIQEKQFF